jgi:hypothetical protein
VALPIQYARGVGRAVRGREAVLAVRESGSRRAVWPQGITIVVGLTETSACGRAPSYSGHPQYIPLFPQVCAVLSFVPKAWLIWM